jgi:hypothetical protein
VFLKKNVFFDSFDNESEWFSIQKC